jgi:hypothetical protein
MTDLKGWKHPVKGVNQDILEKLELVDNKVRPLPGATGRRPGGIDARLSNLKPMTGVVHSDEVTFYDHLATIRYRSPAGKDGDQFFVAFRQTMDALLLEQQDPEKYPEWLMKDPVKKTELKVYIYLATRLPKQVPVLRSHEDWLTHISDPTMFDTLAYFLLRNGIISEEMYGRIS